MAKGKKKGFEIMERRGKREASLVKRLQEEGRSGTACVPSISGTHNCEKMVVGHGKWPEELC